MRGGYKLIDLKNINLNPSGDAIKVPGIYDAIEGSFKSIVISNYKIDGVDKPERAIVFGSHDNNTFDGFISYDSVENNTVNLHVTSEDLVSLVIS